MNPRAFELVDVVTDTAGPVNTAGVVADADCVFSAIAAKDKVQPVVMADEHTVALLDARQVFKGHALVIPRRRYQTLG